MKIQQPIVDRKILLEKFPGKGGWTFAKVPEVLPDSQAPFGWVQVKGTIDNYAFHQVKLMPMGNHQLFFPVKAAIRTAINKQAGDSVHLKLFLDFGQTIIPEVILNCLAAEPVALKHFRSFTEGEKKKYLDWINDAQKDASKIARIVQLIEKSKLNLKFDETYDE